MNLRNFMINIFLTIFIYCSGSLLFSNENDLDICELNQKKNKDHNIVDVNKDKALEKSNDKKDLEKKIEKKELLDKESDLELLDQIEAEVVSFGPEGASNVIVTKADIARRGSYDGGNYAIDDLVDEALADQYSSILKISLSNEDVDRFLKKNNLSQKQLTTYLDNWGYPSLEDFYEDFKKTYRAHAALNFEIDSQSAVSEEEIKKYYNQNPIYLEATYEIEMAFVPSSEDKMKQKVELEELAAKGKIPSNISWELPLVVKESEIEKNNNFILTMPVGSIFVKEVYDGFDLFKLKRKKSKQKVSLEERRREILDILKKEKYEKVSKKVRKNLQLKALIARPYEKYSLPLYSSDL